MAYFDGQRWTWRGRRDTAGEWVQEPIPGSTGSTGSTPDVSHAHDRSTTPPEQGATPHHERRYTPTAARPFAYRTAPGGAATQPFGFQPMHPGRLDLLVGSPVGQARWKTLLRPVLGLPSWTVALVLVLALEVVGVLMWLAALFTARVPSVLWRFSVGVLRYVARMTAYQWLLTDVYPPFSLNDAPYPVGVELDGPPDRLNRAAVLFRVVLALPAAVVTAVFSVGLSPFLFIAWLATLATGRNPRIFHGAFSACLQYVLRYDAWLFVLTTEYPRAPFGERPDGSRAQRPGTVVLSAGARVIAVVSMVLGALSYVAYGALMPIALRHNPHVALVKFDLASLVGTSSTAELQYEDALSACGTSAPCDQRASSVLFNEVGTEMHVLGGVGFATTQTREAAARLANQMGFERAVLQQTIDATTPGAYTRDTQRAQAVEIAVVSGLRQLDASVSTATSTAPPYTGTPVTSIAATRPGRAATVATAIGLQAQDLGTAFTAIIPGAVRESHSAPGRCTQVSGAPWLADFGSPQYSAGTEGPIVYSTVVVMPDAAEAQGALHAVSTPTYGSACLQPGFDSFYQSATATLGAGSPCDSSAGASTISAFPAGSLGAGVTGWRYQTSFDCPATSTTTPVFEDVVQEVVGNVLIQETVRSLVQPPSATFETHVLSLMANRAGSLAAPATATTPATTPATTTATAATTVTAATTATATGTSP